MKTWVCTVCGWVYDEAAGDADYDLAAGVAFEDLPDDFVCPLCGVDTTLFEQQEEHCVFGDWPRVSGAFFILLYDLLKCFAFQRKIPYNERHIVLLWGTCLWHSKLKSALSSLYICS